MERKKGLGKGLDALFGESLVEMDTPESGSATLIEISKIDNNPDQPRKNFDEEALLALSESIREYGILQPLILRQTGSRYEIIAGERRFRAARMAGLKEVPAIVADYSQAETTEVSLIENLHREDLNPIEEASGYEALINSFGLTQEMVAKKMGKSRSAITNALRLLGLPDVVKASVVSGQLSAGHARALLPLGQAAAKLSQEIIKRGLSVRETEKLIQNELNRNTKEEKKPKQNESLDYYKEIEKQIENSLHRKVKVSGNGKKGKIEIEYYDYDDLDALIKILTRG